MSATPVCLCLAALAMLAPAVLGREEARKVKPDREWVDVIAEDKPAEKAPKDGSITDAKAFEKLWKAWRPAEKVPGVNFAKSLVVVTLSTGGQNKPICSATLSKDGDLRIEAVSTDLAGPGFGYSIAVYPKEGVKKVNGKAPGK